MTQNFSSAHVHLHEVLPQALDTSRTELCKLVLAFTTTRRNRDFSLTNSTRELLSQTWMGRQCQREARPKHYQLPLTSGRRLRTLSTKRRFGVVRSHSGTMLRDALIVVIKPHTHTLTHSLSLSLLLLISVHNGNSTTQVSIDVL